MSLFPNDDLLAKEIESWKSFGDTLRKEDRVLFEKMIQDCYGYTNAINIKGDNYSTESLLMSLVLTQQKMIEFLLLQEKNKK
ncbi:MAG: hypothetical protein OEL56_07460 [Nitrosopumilus sp.]|nr:hypothetical protein [Nitrosopumilus sp.]MDH3517010.1 hypothetical protein [Nitrosopumilus sp.]MDH3565613.1 hypothetical protein [Nitrosopumilus sp.]MDH5416566.1 hypothetical protein [Nitrosopumilus sp.]MDH5555166.1 hypothetical protein [Nitrosopumilus sp.]